MKNFEERLKKNIHNELISSGQSEKYFEEMWIVWWSMMGTDFKNGLLKTIKELHTKEDMKDSFDQGRNYQRAENYEDRTGEDHNSPNFEKWYEQYKNK